MCNEQNSSHNLIGLIPKFIVIHMPKKNLKNIYIMHKIDFVFKGKAL